MKTKPPPDVCLESRRPVFRLINALQVSCWSRLFADVDGTVTVLSDLQGRNHRAERSTEGGGGQ